MLFGDEVPEKDARERFFGRRSLLKKGSAKGFNTTQAMHPI